MKTILLHILSIFLISNCFAEASFDSFIAELKQRKCDSVELTVGSKTIKAHFGENTIYVLKKKSYDSRYLFTSQIPIEIDGKLAVKNRYLKLNDQTKTVLFESTDEEILTIDKDGRFEVFNPGEVEIVIKIDEFKASISLKIIEIPISYLESNEKMIEIDGLPDKKTHKYIPWCESEHVDGIFYYTNTSDGSGKVADHWIYKKYPNAVIRMSGPVVIGVSMPSWENLSSIKYNLEK